MRNPKKASLPVDLITAKAGPNSQADIALVSLRDASEIGCEVEYALSKALEYYVAIGRADKLPKVQILSR